MKRANCKGSPLNNETSIKTGPDQLKKAMASPKAMAFF
jgi:hypothetical protein